ncbi:MAG: nucleotide exchange factor GrpE [Pseudomonadales bacterium]|nr:nucleotide exchange factor GrpE [Pseudomonadales bacterium]
MKKNKVNTTKPPIEKNPTDDNEWVENPTDDNEWVENPTDDNEWVENPTDDNKWVENQTDVKQREENMTSDNEPEAMNADENMMKISKDELLNLFSQLEDARNEKQRALADYQNLVRRTKEERARLIKMAARDFIESLIQPLAHLSLASEQIKDPGLNMVSTQLWNVLGENGLRKIDCLGKTFDIETMEVVEKGKKGSKVVKIVKEGFILNDEVIQHAKVILD